MKVQLTARVGDDIREEITRELAQFPSLPALHRADIDIDAVHVEPFEYIEDDGEGGILIAEFLVTIGTGVLTAASVKGILTLVKLGIEKVVNRIRRADKTELTLRTPDEEYNLIKTNDRLRFKARIDKEVVFDDPAEVDRHFSEISELIGKRFDVQ